jgi:hypothetical protein
MSTPLTKKPVRWSAPVVPPAESDRRRWGITHPEVAMLFGFMVSYWPQVEEQMVGFLGQLFTGKPDPHNWHVNQASRLVFRSIVSNKARTKVMTSLLESAPQNAERDREYDDIINEFAALSNLRNKYVHGLWSTVTDDNDIPVKVQLSPIRADASANLNPRTVKKDEIEAILIRMRNLFEKILKCNYPPA